MSSVQPAPAESPRRHRRFLERFTSIRAKLGFVIVFAVGMTVLLTYLLVGYALRGSSHDARQLALIDSARHAASDPSYRPPGGVTIVRRSPGGGWDQRPPVALPVRNDRRFHVGTATGYDVVTLPAYDRSGAWVGTVYAIRRVPSTSWLGRIGDTFGLLHRYWWQLLLGGAIAAALALAMARLLALGLTRPLREMARAAATMARGDYGTRVSTDSRDEVGQLAAAFNRMASELEQVERLRRDLVANVSHELKTPISALRAHLENLLDGVERPDPETLQIMLQQSERLSRLVEQLLDLSRLESGDVPMDPQPMALAPLVAQVVSEVEVAAAGRNAAVRNLVPRDLEQVMADPERIHQVLYNLLDNAVRFTPQDGSVQFTAAVAGDRCEVTVADTGPGIPAEHLPFVFERFYRADPARARGSAGSGGTGIGLAIVRSIVQAHGGTIRAQSEPGRGSAFTFDLPLAGVPAGGVRTDGPPSQGTTTSRPPTAAPRPAVGATATRGGHQ